MKKGVLKVVAIVLTMVLLLATFASCGQQGEQGSAGPQGEQGIQGEKGDDGNGISSIIKTSTEGLVDTYTITFTDGKTTTFTVTNGADGEQGIQGIQGVKGEDGHTPVITIQNGYWYIDGVNTNQSATGFIGATGNGISNIAKTSTDGLVDTYTITFTNGETTTFTVTNGADGAQGQQGIQGIQGEKGADGHTPVITIQNGRWYIDGVDSGKSAEGIKGETGNGISSIAKTDTSGLVDTYTITFTNGDITTFTVTNGATGAQGQQGIQGIQGEKGDDGHTPVITIQNGNWYIDGEDTGKPAEGIQGATGNGISSIAKTNTEGLVDTYTITFTNGDTSTFTVTNGATGAQGEQGIQGIQGEQGEDGHTPIITIQNGKWYIDGVDTGVLAEGLKGETGNGISSIAKTKTEGLIDTYTITFTNGDISTFTVTNGATGAQGEQGIQGIQGEKGDDGHTPVITIQNGKWYIDGLDSGKSAEGVKGDTGNGISSIAKTKTEGLVDTYTITFTNGDITTFTVTNGAAGAQGQQGIQGIQGEKGEDGHTPVITIQNGKWYIDGVDSGVLAEGVNGYDGLSAFEIYQKYHPEYSGTEEEWIESLKGEQGNSVVNTYVDEYYHLWIEFSNGDKVDAGYVGPRYTVTFKDFDESVLSTITDVEYKKGVTAPTEPSRTGYVFIGWDKDFSSVTENITVTAEYEIEEVTGHNQLFFSFKDNGDGTTTATLVIRGEVNLYGLEMKLDIDSVGMEFDSVASSVPGLLANYNGEYILVSFVTTNGTDLKNQTELLTIVFSNTEDVRAVEISVLEVDIFDDGYNDESFSVAGNTYEK